MRCDSVCAVRTLRGAAPGGAAGRETREPRRILDSEREAHGPRCGLCGHGPRHPRAPRHGTPRRMRSQHTFSLSRAVPATLSRRGESRDTRESDTSGDGESASGPRADRRARVCAVPAELMCYRPTRQRSEFTRACSRRSTVTVPPYPPYQVRERYFRTCKGSYTPRGRGVMGWKCPRSFRMANQPTGSPRPPPLRPGLPAEPCPSPARS